MSISTETYYRVLVDLTESLITDGFRRIFIVNGHGGNHELIQLVARDVALRRDATIAAGSWWTIAWDALVQDGAADAGTFPGHSGAFETSLVQAMRPDLVVPPRLTGMSSASSNGGDSLVTCGSNGTDRGRDGRLDRQSRPGRP